MDQSDTDYLKERADTLDELKVTQQERDERIRELLSTNTATVSEVMAVARISKARAYQIKRDRH